MKFPIDEIIVRIIQLTLNEPFITPHGFISRREHIIVELKGGGISGWAEAPALPFLNYNAETTESTIKALQSEVIPLFFKSKPTTPHETYDSLLPIDGNRIARAAIEMAFWDWNAKSLHMPLSRHLGGLKNKIDAGVSLPLYSDTTKLIKRASSFLEAGYKKIKIKIEPQKDSSIINELFNEFPNIPLAVDANGSYAMNQMASLKMLGAYNLLMIEQPFPHPGFEEHAKLQNSIQLPICLDESILDFKSASEAINMKSCRIFNIKPTRVGGHSEAIRINELAQKHSIGVWCGGMLETGIGRAHNIALATLDNFIYPADISASNRYFSKDVIHPEILVNAQGEIITSENPGIGYEVDLDFINKSLISIFHFRRE